MRWFKHMSDLPRDEGVARYLDAANRDRVTAYGFLTLLLEAIATRMDWREGDLICSATYSIPHWGRITYSHPNRVNKYLRLCKVIGWVHVEFEEGMCKVSVPRMVKWRDDYTRKSGHTTDKVAQSRVEENRGEKRERRQDGALSEGLSKKSPRRSPPPDFEVSKVLQEWAVTNYPSVPIEKETAKFKRWEFSPPRNDWDAQWKIWIQRADEHQGSTGAETAASSDIQDMLELGALLELEKNPDESTIEYCNRVRDVNQRRLNTLDG